MIAKKKIWIAAVILAFVTITTPPALLAQESAPGADRPAKTANDQILFPANMWPKGPYIIITPGRGKSTHLGPTGIWAYRMGQNIQVTKVKSGSPADGKVFPGDYIYGAYGKSFAEERTPFYYFANAITEAETEEAGGKLVLDIRRDGNLIQVPIQLEVMGSFSATTPWNCEKSEKIIEKAEEYMRKGLRPESGYPNNGQYMYDPWHDGVLFLLASGNPEMQGLVRRHIHNTIEDIEEWKAGVKHPAFQTQKGWAIGTAKFLFGEYYHRTGDPTVLPYLEPGGFGRGEAEEEGKPGPFNDWTYPPQEPTRYGLHPHGHMYSTMADVLAKEAGLQINEKKLKFDLQYLYVKRAEYGYVKYMGYNAFPIEKRQADAPLEITEEHKRTGRLSAMNGKPAMAAALFSMVDGYDTAVDICSARSLYAYNVTDQGHGGIWFNGFWTPIGASHAGPEKFQEFMKNQQWWRELYRDHTGAMWQEGNARGKDDTMGTGYAIHRTIPRKNLRMFGAPKSMFGPTAPAYMKEAVAAHRNRDYALAEQLTLKLLADGTVPAEDKARVDHFLDSVKTLKESIEYDLAFTEKLLAKQNYVLASIELSQLKMVVSPDNPRLKAIARAVEPKMAEIPTRRQARDARYDAWVEARKARNGGLDDKDLFEVEVASSVHLIKDSGAYKAPVSPGRRGKQLYYPKFGKQELTEWRTLPVKSLANAPQGWEQPGFDDSSWNQTTLATRLRRDHFILLRTHFNVSDVNAFKTLRLRAWAGNQRDMTIYLNGEVVALGSEIPSKMKYDLSEGALQLLRPGKNILAISTEKPHGKDNFCFRLDGILKDGFQKTDLPPQQTARTQTPGGTDKPKALPKPKTHHEEIEFMLAHLKRHQPKMKVGDNEFPGIEVHDYLASFYTEHKSHVTSTDIFLNKVAFKTQGGLIYYVADGKGDKTMLKDWLEQSLPK